MTPEQKAIKNALDTQTEVVADKIISKANGTVEVRRYYYYHMSRTAGKWASDVEAVLTNRNFSVSVTGHDHFVNSGESYFSAIVTPQA